MRWAALLAGLGCSSTAPSTQGLLPKALSGEVTSRTAGLTSSPSWANPNQPWLRSGQDLIVVGYVAIKPEQRVDVGYRAADSYARAELLRFLSTRVVAVLEERTRSDGGQSIRERIEETATAVVDHWPVVDHYWEKRKIGNDERIHVFARLLVTEDNVATLLEQAQVAGAKGGSANNELTLRLKANWGKLGEVADASEDGGELPVGVTAPSWAQGGDKENSDGFSFVCYGYAETDQKARTVAQARCNEKSCRLFGVQISAKTKVTEDLDGTTAQSEVTEQCEGVRIVGRKTVNQGTTCDDRGCHSFLGQSYSRQAFNAERRRLEQPTVISQTVVIHEGNKVYRDPKDCEHSVRDYGLVEGTSLSSYEKRLEFLQSAVKNCSGIDPRDIGLFSSLNTLLMRPLPKIFANDRRDNDSSQGWQYLRVDNAFQSNLETLPAIADRIKSVTQVIDDAIIPLRLVEARHTFGSSSGNLVQSTEYEALVRSVIQKYPFSYSPTVKTHTVNPHVELLIGDSYEHFTQPFSSAYRDYLLTILQKFGVAWSARKELDGVHIARYLARDGLDETEWRAILEVLKRKPITGDDLVLPPLPNPDRERGLFESRLTELSELIANGQIRADDGNLSLMAVLFEMLGPRDVRTLYLKCRSRLRGTAAKKKSLLANGRFWTSAETPQGCTMLAEEVASFMPQAPEVTADVSKLCSCLNPQRYGQLSSAARPSIVNALLKYSNVSCPHIKNDEWPGGYAVWPSVVLHKYNPTQPWPFRNINELFAAEREQCAKTIELEGIRFQILIRGTVASGRVSKAAVQVEPSGELRNARWNKGRTQDNSWVMKDDVDRTQKRVAACFTKAMEGASIPADEAKAKDSRAQRFWVYYSEDTLTQGLGE